MKVALVLLPEWSTIVPPLNISYLTETLRHSGHWIEALDYNITLWTLIKEKHGHLWNHENFGLWENEDSFNQQILPLLEPNLVLLIDKLVRDRFEVIGFSVYSTNWHTTCFASSHIKKLSPRIKIIAGGPAFFSIDPKEMIRKRLFDAVVMGEGEKSIVELLATWGKNDPEADIPGVMTRNQKGDLIIGKEQTPTSLDKLPMPNFDYFDLKEYSSNQLPIMMSRGCISNCAFCDERTLWKKFRMMSATGIVNQFKALSRRYPSKTFVANDSLLNSNHEKLEQVADLILKQRLNVSWGGSFRSDKKLNRDLLYKLKESGCHFMVVGFESGSNKVLKLMNKGITVEIVSQNIKDAHDAGITVIINVIVGFPGEEKEDFEATVDFIHKHKEYIYKVNANAFGLRPRSNAAENLDKFNILSDDTVKVAHDCIHSWVSADKTNTDSVRTNRLNKLNDSLQECGIKQKYDEPETSLDIPIPAIILPYAEKIAHQMKKVNIYNRSLDVWIKRFYFGIRNKFK